MENKEKLKPVECLAYVLPDGRVVADSAVKSEKDAIAQANMHIGKTDVARLVKVKITETDVRSLPQNALFHRWCVTLGKHIGEDADSMKQILKVKFGFPILRDNESPYWPRLAVMFRGCGWKSLRLEIKLQMAEVLPCTSLMTSKEKKQFMDRVSEWAMNQHQITLDNGKNHD